MTNGSTPKPVVWPISAETAFEMTLTNEGAAFFKNYVNHVAVLRTIRFELPDGQTWDERHPEVLVGSRIRLALYGYHFIGQVTDINEGIIEITGMLEDNL